MLLGFIQIAITLVILVAITPLLGGYMARVFLGQKTMLDPVMRPLERLIYALSGLRHQTSMTVWQYIRAVIFSNLIMGAFAFLIFMLQGVLPLNPINLDAPSWDLALHTAISFVTNTNQQHYSGESTYGYFSQMLALGFLMFTSAGTGIAVAIAFIRGLTGRDLGNFYVDLTMSITRILLPISIVGAVILLAAGVPETLAGPATAKTLDGATQYIARGPVAHFEIIKELGENGGGFFGINSAHPFENPNNLTNLLETVIMMAIPASLIYTYGVIVGNTKQAWLLFWMVFVIFAALISVAAIGEYQGNPIVNSILDTNAPNLEGKEVRFGAFLTALWAAATTGTMCGAVNGMHDSLMPSGGMVTMFNLFLQIVWGGQGTGTAYLFIFLILTVFLTGLMVGRTPEFLGRKIEKREIVLASVILLVHPIMILIPGAIAMAFTQIPGINPGITNPGFHGYSQVIYEYASAAANNGSGFEGLIDDTVWWNLSTSVALLAGRYLPLIALLLLADGMMHKQPVPETTGTLRTDTGLFTGITAGVILILGALTFLPVFALGPIAEAFLIARIASGAA
ncbi:potassium-transporting ATPase subunit A [Plectonema cf. radiosum LEGE 06105]|uniref:Potassium-transporting ATPase potassium-binding subunit n=1 Tax=Plectonema cf. radiosum LEGE 06105 TaxID=945769 RepID=A0A8J7FBJ0_9CYAN|nr:potassium-transporting ATPase subunit KdpA [Plectonema radiosum]MBE9213203.1 potassium-transporting ATPase subunit A [Plectonema cf. radiosum LEGE 06105]